MTEGLRITVLLEGNYYSGPLRDKDFDFMNKRSQRTQPETTTSILEQPIKYNELVIKSASFLERPEWIWRSRPCTHQRLRVAPQTQTEKVPSDLTPQTISHYRLSSRRQSISWIRSVTLILGCLFLPTILATSLVHLRPRPHLHNRQAIPDRSGNTGNLPAPVKPAPPPRPPASFSTVATTAKTSPTFTTTAKLSPTFTTTAKSSPTSTTTAKSSPTSTTTATSSSSMTVQPTSTSSTNSTNNGNNNGPNIPPAEELRLTRTNFIMSPGTIAGIATGSGVLFLLLLGLLIFFIRRRRRRLQIAEIPIRRSKLGSRLRHRMFNSPLPPSRTGSRSSGRTLTDDSQDGWLQKESIGRPVPRKWGDGDLLSVPRAAFMRSESEIVERGEKWVDKLAISEPRPARPVSAEPLGRLSGMGLGMGYLK